MMEFIQNFHFLRPWFLLFLLIPFVLLIKKIKANQTSSWSEVCDKNLLDFLIVNETGVKKLNLKKYIYLGLVFASISAAGPTWKKIEIPSFSVENPNMFVLSLAQDMQLTDVSPSRLDRAKYMITDIVDNISSQGQYGMMVYSNEPYLISPITDDSNLIKSLLYQIVPDVVPDSGDRLDRALSLALERFKSAGYSKGNIILLASDVGQRFDLAIKETEKAVALGYTINIIDTSFDGNDKLKLLADNGNGIYLKIFDTSITPLINKISHINDKSIKESKNLSSKYLDLGYYFIFIPILCLLFFFRKGLLIFIFCCFSINAQAGFLLNNNQEGLLLFKKGKFEEAKNKFTDDYLKGLSLYMLDKHEEALDKFDKVKTSDGFYNKGVALVKLCKYTEALKAFEESYLLDSKNEDAKYNIGVLNNLFNKAKDKPELLECNNNQQQNNENESNSNDKSNKEKNNGENNDSSKENKDANQNNENQQSSETKPKNDANENDKQNKEDKGDNGNNGDQNKKEDKNENKQQKSNEQNNQTSNSKENDSKNDSQKTGNGGIGNPEEEDEDKETEASSIKTSKKNKDKDNFNEETMALQRTYREIPEDVGGLLREFIKKEYMKDRYSDENL